MIPRTNLKRLVVGLVTVMAIAAILSASPKDRRGAKPRDVTLTGKIVDLQNVMTGKYASSDHARCTLECIKAGVPAAIETDDGLVVIGEGTKGPRQALLPLAFKAVELKGKLYERGGVRYIDLTSAKAIETSSKPVREEGEEAEHSDAYDEESGTSRADPEGACCLSDGLCIETYEDNCFARDGTFYEGYTCDEVDCEESEP
jgi:hypothetical protein